jgi:hypothetical protein
MDQCSVIVKAKPTSSKMRHQHHKDNAGTSSSANSSDAHCRVITRFRPMLTGRFVDQERLLVVEVPWIRVLQGLAPALQRHRYGT